ncbi:hypothetical protein GCM10010252_06300 [Streptomyces aureoverticillatus]|nr:hypothetical protein GCM10010252_06300 [Streptomyces aureoverticillatus]
MGTSSVGARGMRARGMGARGMGAGAVRTMDVDAEIPGTGEDGAGSATRH